VLAVADGVVERGVVDNDDREVATEDWQVAAADVSLLFLLSDPAGVAVASAAGWLAVVADSGAADAADADANSDASPAAAAAAAGPAAAAAAALVVLGCPMALAMV